MTTTPPQLRRPPRIVVVADRTRVAVRMNPAKELLLVRLGREFADLPESAVIEVVSTLSMLHIGPNWRTVEDQARGLLTTIRCSTRRSRPLTRPAATRQRRLASRTTDDPGRR